jgi:hypothetical protein
MRNPPTRSIRRRVLGAGLTLALAGVLCIGPASSASACIPIHAWPSGHIVCAD